MSNPNDIELGVGGSAAQDLKEVKVASDLLLASLAKLGEGVTGYASASGKLTGALSGVNVTLKSSAQGAKDVAAAMGGLVESGWVVTASMEKTSRELLAKISQINKAWTKLEEGLHADLLADELDYQKKQKSLKDGLHADLLADELDYQKKQKALQDGMRADLLADELDFQKKRKVLQDGMQTDLLADELDYQKKQKAMRDGLQADLLADELDYQKRRKVLQDGMQADLLADELNYQKKQKALQDSLQADLLADELDYQKKQRAVREGLHADLLADELRYQKEQETLQRGLHADLLADEIRYQKEVQAVKDAASATAIAKAAAAARASLNQPGVVAGNYSSISSSSFGEVKGVATDLDRAMISAQKFGLSLNDAHSAARGLASGFNAMWLTWGNLLPLLAGAAISNAVVQVVKMGAEVQNTFETIRVLSGATSGEVAHLNSQMLELARTGPIGPREIAEAMKTLSLAGLQANEVSMAIKDVLNLSMAGNTSIKQAADVMTTVAAAFKIGAEGYNYVGDIITKTAAISKSSVESIGEAFKTASVVNSQYKASLEDIAVGIATLSQVGIQGTAAGTAMRNVYADLSMRTTASMQAFQKLRVNAIDPTTGGMRDLLGIFMDVNRELARFKPEDQSRLIHQAFGERGGKVAAEVIRGLQGATEGVVTELQKSYERIRDSYGFMAASAVQMSLTPLNQMKSVSATLESSLVTAFNGLEPQIASISSKLKTTFNSPEFIEGIRSITQAVGDLTVFLVEHGKGIMAAVAAYAAFKVVTTVASLLTVAAASMQGVALQASLLKLEVVGATASMGIFGTVSATVAAGLSTVVTGVATALGWLARLTPVIGIAVTAWQLYSFYTDKSKASQDALVAGGTTQAVIDGINKEAERLENLIEAKKKNISLDQYDLGLKLETDRAKYTTMITEAQSALAKAQSNVNDALAKGNTGNAKVWADEVDRAQAKLKSIQDLSLRQEQAADQATARLSKVTRDQAEAVRKEIEARKVTPSGSDTLPKVDPGVAAALAAAEAKRVSLNLAADKLIEANLEESERHKVVMLKDAYDQRLISIQKYQGDLADLEATADARRVQAAEDSRKKVQAEWAALGPIQQKALADAAATVKYQENAHIKTSALAVAQANTYLEIQNKLAEADNRVLKLRDAGIERQQAAITMQLASSQGMVDNFDKEYAALTRNTQAELAKLAAKDNATQLSEKEKYILEETLKLTDAYEKKITEVQAAIVKLNPDDAVGPMTEAVATRLATLAIELAQWKSAVDAVKGSDTSDKLAGLFDAKKIDTFAKEINSKFADAILDGGKSGGTSFIKFMEQELLRKPLKILLQGVLQPLSQGLASTALNALGVTNTGGINVSSLMSAGNTAYNWMSGNSAAATGLQWAGNALGVTGAGGSLAMGAGSAASEAILAAGGSAAEAAAAAGAAAASAASGAAAVSSLVSSVMTAAPYLAAAYAAYKIIGSLTGGETRTGVQLGYHPATVGNGIDLQVSPSGGVPTGSVDALTATIKNINGLLTSLGSHLSVAYFTGGVESSQNGKGFDYAGGVLSNNQAFGTGTDGQGYMNNRGSKTVEEAMKAYTLDLKVATIEALKVATDIPKSVQDFLATIDTKTLTDQAATDILTSIGTVSAFFAAVKKLPFEQLANISYDTADALLGLAGGVSNFSTSLQSYADNFYSTAEKTQMGLKTVSDTLKDAGVAMPKTRDEFRKLVEAQDLTTEAGRKAWTALMSVNGAFANLVPEDTLKKIDDLANLQKTNGDLQVQKLQAQGKAEEALALQREHAIAKLDDASKAQAQANFALEDEIKVLNEKKGLQEQLDSLTMTSAQLLNKQRDALDESNKSLFDQVQAAQKAKTVADERKGLQDQLDNATMTSTQLRQKERSAIDDSNKALYDEVQAAKDAKTAADERKGLQEQLDNLTMTSTQLLNKQRDAIQDSNKALFDQVQQEKARQQVQSERTSLEARADNVLLTTAQLRQKELDKVNLFNRSLAETVYKLEDAKTALSSFGVNGLAKMIQDALADPTSINASAEVFAANLSDAVKNALISSVVGQVAEMIMNSIIIPVVAGVAVNDALLDSIVEKATQMVNTIAEVFGSQKFKDAMANVGTMIHSWVTEASHLVPGPTTQQNQGPFVIGGAGPVTDPNSLHQGSAPGIIKTTGLQYVYEQHEVMTGPNAGSHVFEWFAKLTDKAAADRKTLQDQLDSLTLTDTEKLQKQRDLLDDINKGLFDALQIAIKEKAIADERKGLQDQLDNLTMSSEQLYEKQRNAILEANRALWDQVKAAEAAAASLAATKGILDGLAGTKLSLQEQLATLTSSPADAQAFIRQNALDKSLEGRTQKEKDQIIAATQANWALEDLIKTLTDQAAAATAFKNQMDGLLSNADNLGQQLLTAQGHPEQALAYKRQLELWQATKNLNETQAQQVEAIMQSNWAMEDEIKRLNERKNLQDQIDQLTLSPAELLAKQRAALDPTNRELFDILQNAKAAAAALNNFNSAIGGLVQNSGSLQEQLLTAQGNSSGALALKRQREFNNLTDGKGLTSDQLESIRIALQANWATEDEIKRLNERASLQDQLDQATMTATELLEKQRAALDPSNQALWDQVQAAKAAATALNAFNSSMSNIEQNKSSLQEQLLNAQGRPVDALGVKRAREMAAATKDIVDPDMLRKIREALQANWVTEDEIARLNERKGLQDQLDSATMTSAELLKKQRDALDETNRALFDQVQAAVKAKQIADERKGLQDQLDSATMTSAQLLEKQRNALDETNKALFDQVQAAVKAKQVADERKSLQDQLDSATMTSAQLLEKQRNALDETNRALFDQVQAAIKAKQIADERKGLQDQLDSATMTSAQLLEKQRNALDETNRALFDQVQAAQAAAAAMAAMKSALDGLANTKVSLQQQLLTAQGKPLEALQLKRDTELAAALDGKTGDAIAKIAAAVKANWDLEDAISAQTAANQAAADAANAAATAASNAASAAASLKSAWQSLTDTIYAEVQRIRGLMNGGNNAASLAQLQAQFAIETAKARAGDQDAAKLLPSISKDLLDMQATQATTALDLMRAQAQTAASLEATVRILHDQYGLTIPGFAAGGDHAGGWRMVGEHGPEIEATGPSRIFDAATTASMLRSGGSDEEGLTVHELRMIRMALEQVAINTSRTNKFLDKVIVPAPTSGEIAITTRTVS